MLLSLDYQAHRSLHLLDEGVLFTDPFENLVLNPEGLLEFYSEERTGVSDEGCE